MNAENPASRPCPTCRNEYAVILHAMRFHLAACVPLPTAYNIVACSRCGLVYADTPGSQADYVRYYTEFSRYEDAVTASGGADDAADAERLEKTASWLSQYLHKDARVVDIGCGNGGLLAALARCLPLSLTGIDPARRCSERVRAAGFSAWQGHLNQLPEIGGHYDLVILSHVLEHVVDVDGALSSVKNLLAPGGRIYIEVPDAFRYHLDRFPPFYFFDPEHINHFDLHALTALGATHGFSRHAFTEKNIRTANGADYPAVGALLGNASPRTAMPAAVGDGHRLHRSVASYIAASHAAQIQCEHRLFSAVQNHPNLALWGAGSQAQRLLERPALKHARIVAVVDRDANKQGKRFAGCTVRAPEEGLRRLPENTLVIIAAAIHAETIRNEIAAMRPNLPFLVP